MPFGGRLPPEPGRCANRVRSDWCVSTRRRIASRHASASTPGASSVAGVLRIGRPARFGADVPDALPDDLLGVEAPAERMGG